MSMPPARWTISRSRALYRSPMRRLLIPAAVFLLLATAALAQPASSSLVVGPGVIVREKAYLGAQPEVIPIPWIEMRSGRFSLRGLQASYELGGRGPLRVAAIGNLRLGGVESEDLEPRMELLDRDPTVELGLAATLPLRSFRIGAEASADVLGQHGGWDAALRVTRMIRAGRLVLIPGAGVRYWSGELASYEYGLEPGEAGFATGYDVDGSVIPEVSLAGNWTLGPKWSLIGFARASRLGDGIVASPIVGSRTETMLGIGLARRVW